MEIKLSFPATLQLVGKITGLDHLLASRDHGVVIIIGKYLRLTGWYGGGLFTMSTKRLKALSASVDVKLQ